ncbi:peptidoglycan/LPS O-acetylase OafA/YrhL [Dysgonomonas alginatilytica]|uniref:Peptidoglycan/LPS O-acetylase OafA/YrhL n=1 Tax=Dysgonomonas alginatilytica TaxID=1605892 RepID=A0A2V3PNT4_9BACT|nr:acyltransferase [Dysgonomonas alginatilytica]PXV64457.1 peptidoglycan/LPS O-acetylase OafA/YrhL [Dysgonomonas alginatilytica]
METKKYEYIDSLRGIAVLMVLMVHVGNFFKIPTTEYFSHLFFGPIYSGRMGVQLFFIISSFTLMFSFERRSGEKNGTSNFYIRRFFRIAPMYYLAIIAITIYYIRTNTVNWDILTSPWYISNFLFLNTLTPYWIKTVVPGGWSISVEFLFYIIFPFIASRIKNINMSAIALCISLIIATLFIFITRKDFFYSQFDFNQISFYNQLPVFFIGIFAYWLTKESYKEIKNRTWLLFIIVLFLFTMMMVPYYLFYCIIYCILIFILSKKPYKFLCNKWFSMVGRVSFSMYIVHFFLIIMMNNLGIGHLIPVTNMFTSIVNFVLLYMLVFTLTYTISYFSYKFIELPGQNLGKKLIKIRSTK